MAVDEIVISIASNGYFPYEPLFAEPIRDGKFAVIEGNGRLAAVMLLRSPEAQRKVKATGLPTLPADLMLHMTARTGKEERKLVHRALADWAVLCRLVPAPRAPSLARCRHVVDGSGTSQRRREADGTRPPANIGESSPCLNSSPRSRAKTAMCPAARAASSGSRSCQFESSIEA